MRYAEFTNRIGDRLEVRAEDGLVKLVIEAEAMLPAPPNVSVFELDAAAFIKLVAGDLPRLTRGRVIMAFEGEEAFFMGVALGYARDHNEQLQLSKGVFDALEARLRRAIETPVAPIIPDLHDKLNVGDLLNDHRETHFSAHLVRLIAKADAQQREVLRAAYPEHVAMFEAWQVGAPA